MLGGEVYVGFAFAQQLHGLAGFVFSKLINTVTLHTKPKVIGNHRALTVIKIFISVKKSVGLPLLEKQPFGIRCSVSGYILRRAFAVLIGITAVKIGIVGAVDAGSDDFLGVLNAFADFCGNFRYGFLIKIVLILCIQRHGLFQSAVFVYTEHRVPLSHCTNIVVYLVFHIELFEYVRDIFRRLREHGYDESTMTLYVTGGGGCLVKNFYKFSADRVKFVEDICAAAKGYEYLAEAQMKAEAKG